MTDAERIAALEARVAELERKVAALEVRAPQDAKKAMDDLGEAVRRAVPPDLD